MVKTRRFFSKRRGFYSTRRRKRGGVDSSSVQKISPKGQVKSLPEKQPLRFHQNKLKSSAGFLDLILEETLSTEEEHSCFFRRYGRNLTEVTIEEQLRILLEESSFALELYDTKDVQLEDNYTGYILSFPRGIPRILAFEKLIKARENELSESYSKLSGLVLAYERELRTVAEPSSGMLNFYAFRLQKCAKWLGKIGEFERAGEIFELLEMKEQASVMWKHHGEISKLEELFFNLEYEQVGLSFEAKYAYKRFLVLLEVGQRQLAILALKTALQESAQNDFYALKYRQLLELIPREKVSFSYENKKVTCCFGKLFRIGRDQSSDVRLNFPHLPLEFAQIEFLNGDFIVRVLDTEVEVTHNGTEFCQIILEKVGELSFSAFKFDYRVENNHLLLSDNKKTYVFVPQNRADLHLESLDIQILLQRNEQGIYVRPDGVLMLNHTLLRSPSLLFKGDKLSCNDLKFSVK